MNKLIIIHPEDPSTDFLKKIISAAVDQFSEKAIVLKPTLKQASEFIEPILSKLYQEGDIIFFLGHGRKNGLYGGIDENGQKSILMSNEDIKRVFANKSVILFTCDSNELLIRASDVINSYVGFGNMPTDWTEINAEREIVDHAYLSDITPNSLEEFRGILVSMMTKVIVDGALTDKHFARKTYILLRSELNKALSRISIDKTIPFNERIELFKIIQRTKNEIVYK